MVCSNYYTYYHTVYINFYGYKRQMFYYNYIVTTTTEWKGMDDRTSWSSYGFYDKLGVNRRYYVQQIFFFFNTKYIE